MAVSGYRLALAGWWLAWLVAAGLAIAPAAARAQRRDTSVRSEAARLVDDARRQYQELDFTGAVETLHRALAVPGAADAVRLEAYEYLGSSYVVLERETEARQAFEQMLRLDPYHVLREPTGSPKIRQFAENIRRQVAPDAALDPDTQLRAQLPRAGRVGRPTRVRFDVEGPGAVVAVTVYVRSAEDEHWTRLRAAPDDNAFAVEIPARTQADELEIYAEGRDERGRVVTRSGEPLAPLSVPIRIERGGGDEPALITRWWFWTAVAAAAAAIVVVGIVAISQGQSAPTGTLPPGRVELP